MSIRAHHELFSQHNLQLGVKSVPSGAAEAPRWRGQKVAPRSYKPQDRQLPVPGDWVPSPQGPEFDG